MKKESLSVAELAGLVGVGHAGLAGLSEFNKNPEPHERDSGPIQRGLVRAGKTLAGYAAPAALTYGLAHGLGPESGTVLGTMARSLAIPAGVVGGALLPGVKMGSKQVQELAKIAVGQPLQLDSIPPAVKARLGEVMRSNPGMTTDEALSQASAMAFREQGTAPYVRPGASPNVPPPADRYSAKGPDFEAPKPVPEPQVRPDAPPADQQLPVGSSEAKARGAAGEAANGNTGATGLVQSVSDAMGKDVYKGGPTWGQAAPGAAISALQAYQGNPNDKNSGGLVPAAVAGAGAVAGTSLAHHLMKNSPDMMKNFGPVGALAGYAGGRLLPSVLKMSSARDLAKIAMMGEGTSKKPDDGMSMCKECKMKHERGLCKQANAVAPASGLTSYVPVRESGIQQRLAEALKKRMANTPIASTSWGSPAQKMANLMVGYEQGELTQPMGMAQTSPFTKQVGAPIASSGSFGMAPGMASQGSMQPPMNITAPHMAAPGTGMQPAQSQAFPVPRPMNPGRTELPGNNMDLYGGPAMAPSAPKPAAAPVKAMQPGSKGSVPPVGSQKPVGKADDKKKAKKKGDEKSEAKKEDKSESKDKEASDTCTFTNHFMSKWNSSSKGSISSKLELFKGGANMLRKSVLPQ